MKGRQGSVAVHSRNGRLSLRFRDPAGRERRLSLGLTDSRAGRGLAEVKAQLIESDLQAGTYDPTHRRYLAEKQHQYENRSVQELWDLWVATEKVQYLDAATLGTKYRATRSRLVEFFQNRSVVGIDREQVAEFVAWYRALVSPGVLKERLTLIRACWQWALEQKYVEINPWNNRVKVPAKERPEPFTEDEVRRILQVFQEVPRFQHYRDFVEFVLTTGCRTGEAAALTWSGVRKQESQIVFFASKTNKIRVVEIPSELTEMLRHRRLDWGETDRVFTSVRGRPINKANFRDDVWTPVLQLAEVPYRPPYHCRHTMISHGLDQGLSAIEIAEIVGNTPRTIYQHYAASVKRIRVPRLLSGGGLP